MTASSSTAQLPYPSLLSANPLAESKNQLEVLHNNIDIEEESQLYDELAHDEDYEVYHIDGSGGSFQGEPSIYSRDIWLGDNYGESLTFAREVDISGWINVGDKPEGGYIVYDCAIRTNEGTTIHAHKRYSDFVQLDSALRHSLPRNLRHIVPELPPKAPLARYRPAFLDRRRRLLQSWLASVLLHPDIGGSQAAKLWIMD